MKNKCNKCGVEIEKEGICDACLALEVAKSAEEDFEVNGR